VNFGRWPLDYVTLWLSLFHFIILHPWNLLVPTKHQFVSVLSKYHLFLASLQAHQFYHLKYHSHSLHFPMYRKHYQIATHTVQTFQKFSHDIPWRTIMINVKHVYKHLSIICSGTVLFFFSFSTHTDDSRVSKAMTGVCVWVCLSVWSHDKTKKAESTITKLGIGIVHHDNSPNDEYYVKRSKVTGEKMQKAIEWLARVMHSIECPASIVITLFTIILSQFQQFHLVYLK